MTSGSMCYSRCNAVDAVRLYRRCPRFDFWAGRGGVASNLRLRVVYK